jgi:hypothetical protein
MYILTIGAHGSDGALVFFLVVIVQQSLTPWLKTAVVHTMVDTLKKTI